MEAFINQSRFVHAVEYASEHLFSKPYSITPSFDRWFNQLAMIEFQDGTLVHFTGKVATEFLTITVDGAVVNKEQLQLIAKFYSLSSSYEQDKAEMEKKIKKLTESLNKKPNQTDSASKLEELEAEKAKLVLLDADKEKAKKLYDSIVARGTTSIDRAGLEERYQSKIKGIMHRPNHGILHSVRAAYTITTLNEYRNQFDIGFKSIKERELEQLQLMMLFSVVGRGDETGFNDSSGKSGNAVYKSFRAASGREYLAYIESTDTTLYSSDLESKFRDAIVVELMGYSKLQNVFDDKLIPELFIDYVQRKEQEKGLTVGKEEASRLIKNNKYSLKKLFDKSSVPEADAKLKFMNDAHGLDLTRCYPLYPTTHEGAKSVVSLEYHLWQSGFFDFDESPDKKPDPAVFTTFFKLIRCSFDLMELTGQNTTFGMLSNEEFEAKKQDILKEVQEIINKFADASQKETLLDEAKKANEADDTVSYFSSSAKFADELLQEYRDFLIMNKIADRLQEGKRLVADKRMFFFQNSDPASLEPIDHDKNAARLVYTLQTVKPFAGIAHIKVPEITEVEHDRLNKKVTLIFENNSEATHFVSLYHSFFGGDKLSINQQDNGIFRIEAARDKYQELQQKKLVTFKKVTIPKAVSAEDNLIDSDGTVSVLNLVAHSRAMVRLVSTTPLSGESFPDYEYLLNPLEDPVHERYTVNWGATEPTRYSDPRSGESYERPYATEPLSELKFQEPITKPKNFDDLIAEGWTKNKVKPLEKNTIYTKKMAYSQLPYHGKVVPFEGYPHKRHLYFPIGVLSDREQMDLKSERYVWSNNMGTMKKFWIRDTSDFNKSVYRLLRATLDDDDAVVRDTDSVAQLDKEQIPVFENSEVLVLYLQSFAEKFTSKMNEKYYRPSDQMLADCKALLEQQRVEYLIQLKGDKENTTLVEELFKSMTQRLSEEASRKSSKYSIGIRELIELQKKTTEASDHNEILASNTKAAVRALYACKDELFDRLNLVFHALEIKKKYKYDIPLMVMSVDKSPYIYTGALVQADLVKALELIKAGTFPYDNSLCTAFELDDKGQPVIEKGSFVRKKDELGDEVQIVKDQVYQQRLLLDVFKLGLPQLKNLNDLATTVSEEQKEKAFALIIDKLDLVGSSKREERRVTNILEQANSEEIERVFFREVALGHQHLVERILINPYFKYTSALLEKAIVIADNNHQPNTSDYLQQTKMKLDLDVVKYGFNLQDLKSNSVKMEEQDRIDKITQLDKVLHYFKSKGPDANLAKEDLSLLSEIQASLLLNKKSHASFDELSQMRQLLIKEPVLLQSYIKLIDADNAIDVGGLLKLYKEHGLDVMDSVLRTSGAIDIKLLNDLCWTTLDEIKQQKIGNSDKEINTYVDSMSHELENNATDFIALCTSLKNLNQTLACVNSDEMREVRALVTKYENASFLNLGTTQIKASKIKAALAQVPLAERLHVFTNEDNPACNEVRKAIAKHRFSFIDPVHGNKVVKDEAAQGFIDLQDKLNNKKQENAFDEDVDSKPTDGTVNRPGG